MARTVRERPGRIGKTLLISGTPTQIIGVMPGRCRFPNAATKLWLPMRLDPHSPFLGGFNYDAVARLKPGMSIEAAQRDFTNVLPRVVDVAPNMAPGLTMRTVLDQAKPIPRIIPMRDDVVGELSQTLWMVAATAILGLVAAIVAIRLLVRAGPTDIPRLAEVRVDGTVVAFTVIVAALVALGCSAIPAIRFMRGDPLSGLRDGGRDGTAGGHRHGSIRSRRCDRIDRHGDIFGAA